MGYHFVSENDGLLNEKYTRGEKVSDTLVLI